MQPKAENINTNKAGTDQLASDRTTERTVEINLGQRPPPPPPAVRVTPAMAKAAAAAQGSAKTTGDTSTGNTQQSRPFQPPTLPTASTGPSPPPLPAAQNPTSAHSSTPDLSAPASLSPIESAQMPRKPTHEIKPGPPVLYLSIWGLAGLVAAAYVFLIVTKPETFANILPVQWPTAPESNEGQRAKAKAMAEAESSKGTLSKSQLEIAEPKVEIAKKSDAENQQIGLSGKPEHEAEDAVSVQSSAVPAIVITETPVAHEPSGVDTSSIAAASAPETPTPTVPKILNATPTSDAETSNVAEKPSPENTEAMTATTDAPQPPALDPVAELADATAAIETSSIDKPADANTSTPDPEVTSEVDIPLPARKGPVPKEFLAALKAEKAASEQATQRVKETTITATEPPSITTGFETTTTTTTSTQGQATTTAAGFGEPIVTRAPNSIGVVLATGPSVDALRLSWSLLSENHSSTLGGLTPRYITSPSPDGPIYSLVAGPLPNDKAAADVCISVISRGIPCRPGTYSGNAL